MNKSTNKVAIISGALLLIASLFLSAVSAQQTVVLGDENTYVLDKEPLDQGQLDQVLAPIALYPDSLLSQILVAATYPLEVVQASRWREVNQLLTEKQVLSAIEDKKWDPSVKALTPFTDLLARLSKDLDWLQQLGDAFLENEDQVLASIQDLRQKARDNGSIADNDYYKVVEDNDNIIINSTNREIIYVPYYDSRVVYGPWGWNDYQPVYWHRPSRSRLHAGFYWSDRSYIRPTIFFGGFHWGSRNLVVNHHYYDRPYRNSNRYRNIGVSNYRPLNHNPVHRRGARYSHNGSNRAVHRNRIRADRESRRHTTERRRVGNRVISKNPRNPDNLRRAQRSRTHYNTQKPAPRATNTTVIKNRVTNNRVVTTNRSVPRERTATRPGRYTPDANRSRASSNPRPAPVASKPPKRDTSTQQSNRNTNNRSVNHRTSARNTKRSQPKAKASSSNPRRQPR